MYLTELYWPAQPFRCTLFERQESKKGSRNCLARFNYIPQMCIGQYNIIGTHQIGISHLGVRHARKLNPKTILEQLTYVLCVGARKFVFAI